VSVSYSAWSSTPGVIHADIQTVGEQPNMDEKVQATKATNVITLEDVAALLDKRDQEKAAADRLAELEAIEKEHEALKAQIAEAAKEKKENEQVKRLQNPTPAAQPAPPVQVYSKWDGFTVSQLGLAYDLLKAQKTTPSMELFRVLHAKATKMVDTGEIYQKQIVRDKNDNILREFSPTENEKLVKAIKAIKPMELADTKATKADEVMYSTQAGFGDEWVPPIWSAELWDLVRNDTKVLQRFRQVEVPGESLTIPTLSGRTTVYKVGQTTDESTLDLPNALAVPTKAGTSNVTLTPVKGMAWLPVAEEFVEDSIIPVISSLEMALRADIAEQVDEILISGDTDTATTNISDTGNASIATTWHLLMVNGLRDYAFANSNTSDRGALTAEDFLAVMALLGTNGAFALDPEKLFWVLDPGVYRKVLALGEIITADKEGNAGTFTNGRLTQIFASDAFVTDQYGATDANGKIHNTTANNTKGSFLLVRPDRWVVGFGRRLRLRALAQGLTEAVTDTQHIVASFRLDFKNNGEGSAVGFNITT
jgi:hypothetical protein